MAIAFRGASAHANTSAALTLTCPLPAGTQAGDLLLAYMQLNNAPVITPPSGWVLAPDPPDADSNPQGGASLWYTIAGASEPNPTWTWNASSTQSGVMIGAWSGVDPTTPLEQVQYQQIGASTALDWPAVTNSTANALAAALVLRYYNLNTNPHNAPPSPFTQRAAGNSLAASSTYFVYQIADAPLPTVGTVDPGTQGTAVSSTRIVWIAVLREDAAAPPVEDRQPFAVLVG